MATINGTCTAFINEGARTRITLRLGDSTTITYPLIEGTNTTTLPKWPRRLVGEQVRLTTDGSDEVTSFTIVGPGPAVEAS